MAHTRTMLVGALVALSLVVLGVYGFSKSDKNKAQQIPGGIPPAGTLTMQGTAGCVPKRNPASAETLECLIGIRDDAGRYFAVTEPGSSYEMISRIVSGKRYEVSGKFTPREGSHYADIGVIEIQRVVETSQ